jgi:hypothetical protein
MTNRIAGLSGNKRIILGVTSESDAVAIRSNRLHVGRSRRWNIHGTTSKSFSSSRAAIMEIIVCKAATFEIPFH